MIRTSVIPNKLKEELEDVGKVYNSRSGMCVYPNAFSRLQTEIVKVCNVNKELEQQIEKLKKYGKLLLDICTVMGNDPYMVWAGLENRVKVLWDLDEEARGLKMADDILDRLLKISAVEWAEINKWE